MVAMVVIGNAGGSLVNNVSLLLVCLAFGIAVQAAAPAIHQLRRWKKVAANIAMTVLAVLALAWISNPQLVQAALAVDMGCTCYWGWESWCCYI